MEILNELDDAKKALEEKANALEEVKSFNTVAFELAVALNQLTGTPVYALEYGAKAFGIKVSEMQFGENGDLYYTLSYQCVQKGEAEDKLSQIYSNEIYVPAEVVKSKDPVVAAKIHNIMTELGYAHSTIHSSSQWIEEKLKEEESLIAKLSKLLNDADPYSEQRSYALKRVLNDVFAEKRHKPENVVRLSVNELMKVSELSSTLEFAQLVAELLNKNLFKRVIILNDIQGQCVAEYSTYEEVPNEIFDKTLGMTVPVLATQLKTVYEYLG